MYICWFFNKKKQHAGVVNFRVSLTYLLMATRPGPQNCLRTCTQCKVCFSKHLNLRQLTG